MLITRWLISMPCRRPPYLSPLIFNRVLVPVVGVVGLVVVLLLWNNYRTTTKHTVAIQSQVTAEQNLITINNKAIAAITEQNRVIQVQIQPITDQANILLINPKPHHGAYFS